jgi:hypothetical protein
MTSDNGAAHRGLRRLAGKPAPPGSQKEDTGTVQHDYGDDYEEEPSWPVAVVIGALVLVVGVIVRVRDCVSGLFSRRKDSPRAEQAPFEAAGDDEDPLEAGSAAYPRDQLG